MNTETICKSCGMKIQYGRIVDKNMIDKCCLCKDADKHKEEEPEYDFNFYYCE